MSLVDFKVHQVLLVVAQLVLLLVHFCEFTLEQRSLLPMMLQSLFLLHGPLEALPPVDMDILQALLLVLELSLLQLVLLTLGYKKRGGEGMAGVSGRTIEVSLRFVGFLIARVRIPCLEYILFKI